MGFNIGSFIGALAPAVGSIFGPVGAAIGGAIGAGLAPRPQQAVAVVGRQTQPAQQFPAGMTSVVPVPVSVPRIGFQGTLAPGTNGFGVQRRRVGFVSGAARAVAPFFGAGVVAGGIVSEILQRARENSGQRVTKNKIIDSARACGIELTADTFGLSESDVCKVIVAGRSRRRRGVSAADVRRTKRTLRFVRSIKKDLKAVRL